MRENCRVKLELKECVALRLRANRGQELSGRPRAPCPEVGLNEEQRPGDCGRRVGMEWRGLTSARIGLELCSLLSLVFRNLPGNGRGNEKWVERDEKNK